MSKLQMLKNKINNLDSGQDLWIGNDFDLNEMQSVMHLIKGMMDNGEIGIKTEHRESKTGHRLIDIVRIVKL